MSECQAQGNLSYVQDVRATNLYGKDQAAQEAARATRTLQLQLDDPPVLRVARDGFLGAEEDKKEAWGC